MEENIKQTIEFQHSVKGYYLTLLSGEIITLENLNSDDITETREDTITICISTQLYIDRLYQAFKNKELVEFIRKDCTYRNACTIEEFNREFTYNHYFKITEFTTSLDANYPATYNITFETV